MVTSKDILKISDLGITPLIEQSNDRIKNLNNEKACFIAPEIRYGIKYDE